MKKYVHRVQYYETDKMQITHHSNYIRIMEEARIDYLRQIGYSFERIESEGMLSPVTSVNANYKKSTVFGDEIQVAVRLANLTAARFSFEYEMTCRGDIVCTGKSEHCFVDKSGKVIALKKQKPELYDLMLKLSQTTTPQKR